MNYFLQFSELSFIIVENILILYSITFKLIDQKQIYISLKQK
jgi:hypothetical protein